MPPFDFDAEVIKTSFSLPVLVDFWAPWCGPCRALTPVLERVAERYRERFTLVKVNTEEQPAVAERYRIRSIPNVKLFVDGAILDEFSGAMPEGTIGDWLKRTLPSPHRGQVNRAEQWIAEGRSTEAAALLEDVLVQEPGHERAALLLAQVQLRTDHRAAARTVEKIGPGADGFASAEAIRTLARLFDIAEEAILLPESAVKETYLKAARALAQGDYRGALTGLIGVVRSARSYDDDGARKACVAIFRYLGDDHELTREFRGALSSALYV
jgi:putative thioredoxin